MRRVSHPSFRDQVQDMKPLDAVEWLLGIVEMLVAPAELDWNLCGGVKLENHERRIFRLLAARSPEGCHKDAIYAAMTADKADCYWPDVRIVQVKICTLRRKLIGTPFRIETLWGSGYRMIREPGAAWPWEDAA
jgi:DNA-binding response OmpR family regulator